MTATFLAAVVVQVIVMSYEVSTYDESLSLYGALRVAHGQVPYRDFWTMYPPGQFYLLAALFRLFGVMGLWGRAVFVVTNAISAAAMLHILAQITARRWLSVVGTGAILLWLNARASYAFPIYPAMTLILVATACMLHRWRGGPVRLVFMAGAALGIAALFRHDLALYALVALGGASLLHEFARSGLAAAFGDVIRLCAVTAIIVVPVVVLLLVVVPAHDLYYSLLYVPGVIYPKVRALPFPNLHQVLHGFRHAYSLTGPLQGDIEYNIVWVPLLVVAAAAPALVRALRSRATAEWRVTAVAALTLLTVLLFLKGSVRVSPLHMAPAIVAALMTLTCMVATISAQPLIQRVAVLFVAAWAVMGLFATAHFDYTIFRKNLRSVLGSEPGRPSFAQACHPPEGLERARCMYLRADETAAILYLESRTAPGEAIFVGVPRYDLLHLSNIEIYFFSGREAATRWYDLHPGVETTAPIQREMIGSLERARVSWIVRDDLIYPEEPNQSRVSSGVNILGEYIDSNYTVQRTFGKIDVLKRATPFRDVAQTQPAR